jgi:hypothetical protein
MRNTKLAAIAALTIAPAALLAAPAASASPHATTATYKATTTLTNRPDGGNGGTWALDKITRTLTITVTGTPGSYHDTATVQDTGTFDLSSFGGALTPNQSTPGTRITARPQALYTSISGKASYSFTSDSLPSSAANLGVPKAQDGSGYPTSDWYAQAFGPSAVVSHGGITTWEWDYAGGFNVRGALRFEQWADAWNNGFGNLPADGDITG